MLAPKFRSVLRVTHSYLNRIHRQHKKFYSCFSRLCALRCNVYAFNMRISWSSVAVAAAAVSLLLLLSFFHFCSRSRPNKTKQRVPIVSVPFLFGFSPCIASIQSFLLRHIHVFKLWYLVAALRG